MDGIDFDFCQRQYGFSREQCLSWFAEDVLSDYRTPNPLFDPISYLLTNNDVATAHLHPVRHFLKHGFKEGRTFRRPTRYRSYETSSLSAAVAGEPRVAIVLHIFYAQYIMDFVEKVKGLLYSSVKVFISTTEEIFEECVAAFKQALPVERIECAIAPNRGRNISPMITIFSEQLLDYDVIFHCHSKLSEYSGRQQIEWGSYLIAAIIGNSSTFGKHVDAIASGCCDLIAPAPFHRISPIACHSLSNDAALSALYERLGMPAATGFMTYPIGGMFVASQSLFRRLMALGIKLDDFPVEPSRPDGELHHAVERILGTIAGERLSFFDQILQEYCGAKSVLQGEMMRFSPLDDLDEAIFQHQTICFDFFDTLCCRCSGDEEWAKKFVDRIHQSPYRSIRNRAEESIRARSPVGKDVSLTEIVGQLEASQLDNLLRLVGSERAIDFADLRVITPIARSYAKAVSSGKEVLIVSDTYYGADFITSFLDLHSLPRPSQILASSEIGLRKDRGDMWDLIVSRFKRPIIHVGDNVRSDIQAASDRGITAFYVPHWRNALLQTNGLSQTVNALNSHNACFNRFADVVAATTGVLSKDKDVGKVPSEMVSP